MSMKVSELLNSVTLGSARPFIDLVVGHGIQILVYTSNAEHLHISHLRFWKEPAKETGSKLTSGVPVLSSMPC